MEYVQELDCIYNEELPWIPIARVNLIGAKSDQLQGMDWEMMAASGQGLISKMAGLGDWWIWEQ